MRNRPAASQQYCTNCPAQGRRQQIVTTDCPVDELRLYFMVLNDVIVEKNSVIYDFEYTVNVRPAVFVANCAGMRSLMRLKIMKIE